MREPRLARLRDERFERVPGKRKYDAILGISGGKDSSWLALQLVRKHRLKVLTFTFVNGFFTNSARDNVRLLVDKLGVDPFFHEPDGDLHKSFTRLR